MDSNDSYLLDLSLNVVHTWTGSALPGDAAYLRDNGNLVRTYKISGYPGSSFGGSGGGVQEFAWDGSVLWDFQYVANTYHSHHDIALTPAGNVFLLVWEDVSRAGAIAAGRDPSLIQGSSFWSEKIIELDPNTGSVIWEWRVWDHLVQDYSSSSPGYGVITDNPQLLDLNFPQEVPGQGDWLHCNSIDYSPVLDQLIMSCRNFDEIWVIDHSTTTAEAAGHSGGNSGKGGDILYRWGNPIAYGRGTNADRQFFQQHDTTWIADGLPGAGNILVFNNGNVRPTGAWSSVDELVPPVDTQGNYSLVPGASFEPSAPVWSWFDSPPTAFFAPGLSGVQRLENGNTLITKGPFGYLLEVDSAGNVVWDWNNPTGGKIFKTRRYQRWLWPGDAEFSAASGGRIELSLVAGTERAGRPYWVGASFSGTTPGTAYHGLTIPLNWDFFSDYVIRNTNSAGFVDFRGSLDASGSAIAVIDTLGPISSAYAGVTAWFAFALTDQWNFVSNAVAVQILP
jgi:hypothetical protein